MTNSPSILSDCHCIPEEDQDDKNAKHLCTREVKAIDVAVLFHRQVSIDDSCTQILRVCIDGSCTQILILALLLYLPIAVRSNHYHGIIDEVCAHGILDSNTLLVSRDAKHIENALLVEASHNTLSTNSTTLSRLLLQLQPVEQSIRCTSTMHTMAIAYCLPRNRAQMAMREPCVYIQIDE